MTKYKLHHHSPYDKKGAKCYVNDREKRVKKLKKNKKR